jgi:hypothetical protein
MRKLQKEEGIEGWPAMLAGGESARLGWVHNPAVAHV